MKTHSKLASLLAALVIVPVAQSKAADVSVDFFYDNLDDHGEWVEVADYGYCWHPRDVSNDWRPYNDGHWVYTDAGWTWVSDEPYGWAVYHYGRWTRTERVGWVWVPDTEWAPAWVSWRRNDRYVGWAPLPPESRGRISVSLGGWVDAEYDIGPTYYSFVEVRQLGAPRLRSVVLPPRENLTIINQTTNITNITYQNNVIINNGPDYNVVARQVDQPIRRLKLDRRSAIADVRGARAEQFKAKVEGESLVVAAPPIQKAEGAKPKKVAQKIDKAGIDRGWKNAGDVKQVETARAKIKDEAKQAKESPATTVQGQTPGQPADATSAPAPTSDRPATAEDSTKPAPGEDATKPGRGKGRDRKATAAQPPAPGQPGESAATPDANAPGKVETPGQPGVAQEKDQPAQGRQRGKNARNRDRESAQTPEAIAEEPKPGQSEAAAKAAQPDRPQGENRPGRRGAAPDAELPSADQPGRPESERPQAPGRERSRQERPDRQARPDQPNTAEPAERPQRPDRPERAERPDRPARPEGVNRPERAERPDRPERAAQPERPPQPDRPPQAERPNRERPAGPGAGAREVPQQRPERSAQPEALQNRPPQAGGPGRGPGGQGRGAEEGKKKGAPENE